MQAKVRELDVRPADIERLARKLSGGNQQKVVLAKWLLTHARILLLDEPTRGVDIAAKKEIYATIADSRRAAGGFVDLLGAAGNPRHVRPHPGHARRPLGRRVHARGGDRGEDLACAAGGARHRMQAEGLVARRRKWWSPAASRA